MGPTARSTCTPIVRAPRRLTASSLAALCLAAPLASAAEAPAHTTILLQSYSGAPPEDGQYFVKYLLRTLADQAPLHGEDLKNQIESKLSRAAGTTEPPKRLRLQVEEGRRQFIEGTFQAAIRILERSRRQLLEQAALVASDQGLRDAMHRALLFLAHAYLRNRQGQLATERVVEAIRSFPDRELSLVSYGPDLVSFYKKVRQELDRHTRGTLTITTQPKGCLVFLNERFVGLSPARVTNLYPGMYRVYVQRPQKPGRIHRVGVDGGEQQIAIDFDLDRVLRTEPFVGLSYPQRRQMIRDEVKHAASIARALDASLALVLGFRKHQGRRTMQGTIIAVDTGRVLRSAMVALEPAAPSPETLKALGQFLLVGKQSAGIIVRSDHPQGLTGVEAGGAVSADPPDRQTGRFFSARVFKWITLGLAVAALASGITLIALDGHGTCQAKEGVLCPQRYETLPLGIALTASGGAAALTSGALFYLDRTMLDRTTGAITLAPQGLGPVPGLGALIRF